MGKRFTATSYDRDGTAWTVDVYDADYSSTVTSVNLVADSIELTYTPIEEIRTASILTGACRFILAVESSSLNNFVDDLALGSEERFRATISRAGSLEFAGIILTDQVRYADRAYPYELEINAVDGISRLKDVEYADDTGANLAEFTGKETFIQHLTRIIDKIGTADLLGTDVLTVSVNWFENSHASTSIDSLANTRFDHRTLLQYDNQTGTPEYQNTLDVLRMIADNWNARFTMSGGRFRFMQINSYIADSFQIFTYNSSGTQTSTSTGNSFNIIPANRLFGGVYAYFPGLRQFNIEYIHRLSTSVIGDADFGVGYTEEDIDASAANTALFIRSTIRSYFSDGRITTAVYVFYEFEVEIDDGTTQNYLKRDVSIVNGTPQYGDYEWTTSAADRVTVVSTLLPPAVTNGRTHYQTTVATIAVNEVPFDGDLYIRGIFAKSVDVTGAEQAGITPDVSPGTEFINPYLEISDLTDRSNSQIIRAKNGADGYTAEQGFTSLFGDGPSGNAVGSMEVSNGSVWTTSGSWAVGSTAGGNKFQRVSANQALSGQVTPVPRFQGLFEGFAVAHNSITDDGTTYMPTQITIRALQGEIEGDWFEVASDTSNIDEPSDQDFFIPKDKSTLPIDIGGGTIDDPLSDPGRIPRSGSNTDDNIYLKLPPFTTDDDIDTASAITSIPTTEATADDIFQAGDKIDVIDRITGQVETFTVAADVQAGDTSISVVSQTPSIPLSDASYITLNTETLHTKLSKKWYRQTFSNHATPTLTVTENGGTLPNDENSVFVYANGQRVFAYTINNSDIELGFTPPGMDFVVEFWL